MGMPGHAQPVESESKCEAEGGAVCQYLATTGAYVALIAEWNTSAVQWDTTQVVCGGQRRRPGARVRSASAAAGRPASACEGDRARDIP
jgi:hypothetical protein